MGGTICREGARGKETLSEPVCSYVCCIIFITPQNMYKHHKVKEKDEERDVTCIYNYTQVEVGTDSAIVKGQTSPH